MESLSDMWPRPKIWRLHLLWFSRYLNSKFWSRDYHVMMTSQNFVVMVRNVRDLHTFHMLCWNRLYLLWFSRYWNSKFWSRDYDVIGRGQNFLNPISARPPWVSTTSQSFKFLSILVWEKSPTPKCPSLYTYIPIYLYISLQSHSLYNGSLASS